MTCLEAVAGYLPSESTPVSEILGKLGVEGSQIALYERFYGFSQVRRAPGAGLRDLMLSAAGRLDALRGAEHRVRYVLYPRTIQLCAPYPINPLHDVCAELGLRHATAFSVTQHACASGLLAVDIAGRLLAADGDPDALALVFAGEKAFTPSAQLIRDTAIMGEGMATVLVSAHGDRDRLLGYATQTKGQFHGAPFLPVKLDAEFEAVYPATLAEVVLAAVRQAGLRPSDIDLVLPHNVNLVSWLRVAKMTGLPRDRIFLDNLPVTGHCFCADSFINHQSARELGRLRPGDHYLMTAVGLGATFSAMVFRH
ncbi:3-oxoacyl-[acyl-carrier-protein] synthase III C-terminal domain-containing protein [Marinitenerispora sediminis]|uniref:3-oxoacyl-ACP synthase n=1 Tax=Marinitenerispora sediminis TaxID=1931232 RepID=A0A368T0J8_9ACTN|nr:3-oxoacyl-[acyl-carrier-protein] synthase III C-terminal domain-containing protein [Marinitenerispora sediminis]RCV48389.1 3-oxoacyl-ACP synthase [Marinitenerispora sediminis]RCV52443.1 3-oxoacyl-ACP synthase [Marinitenerispora sediminis]RCV60099.1 3-oxoacyl-ACP synthase [Marinitenerispora sediminis]